jgi:hypothetical protein
MNRLPVPNLREVQLWATRAVVFALFIAPVAALSSWPPYRLLEPDQAVVKLSLRHSGVRLVDCRERSAQELADLPPNMRTSLDCPRERSPLVLQMEIGGRRMVDAAIDPRGLRNDGRAAFYRRIVVPAGRHALTVRMKDDIRAAAFPFELQREVELRPGQILVVDFDSQSGRFVLI